MPPCHDVQAEEYKEDSLSMTRRIGIWSHLLLCTFCARFLLGLETLAGIAKKSLVPPQVAPDAADKAMSEVLEALRNRQLL